MHYKHPEFLYVLIALVIPILVHLFQLRRFQKIDFTNVWLLKTVVLQTRKSSRIKKWLTLLTRLLIFAAIIIAFAQPFLASKNIVKKNTETVIYLDNSFSMQAKGPKGALLKRAVQEIIEHLPEEETLSLFTNTETFTNVSKKDIYNDLLQIDYAPTQLLYSAAYLKAKKMLSNSPNTNKRVIMVSDFQQKEDATLNLPSTTEIKTHLVQLSPVSRYNIAIDSLYTKQNANNDMMLHVVLSNTEATAENISIALYNKDLLLAKTTTSIPKNRNTEIEFAIAENSTIQGKVTIEDPALSYDNARFFTINTPKKINVLAINETNDRFIKNIFTPDEFSLISTPLKALNYNDIANANLIIINELQKIPLSLGNALKTFVSQGGNLCIIPAVNADLNSYRDFMSVFSAPAYLEEKLQKKKVTTIHFSHSLYRGVFDKKVTNFQYPEVNQYYKVNASETILSYEDNAPFLYKSNSLYIFTAAINSENSNFKNSPLIVPTLYNIGKTSLKHTDISYTIGQTNSYDISVPLEQDGVVELVLGQEKIIPLQQRFSSKVHVTTNEVPTKAGIYSVRDKDKLIQYVSYNYSNDESNLRYYTLNTTQDYQVNKSVTHLFNQIKEETSVNELWKWFIIFALVFLLIEILLLKYLK